MSASFKRQPIIPYYGYYTRHAGQELFFGVVRLLKDPQRYFNSYVAGLMDLLDRPQHEIPVFINDQLATTAKYWASMREDNPNFLLVDPIVDAQGNPQPVGPISSVQPSQLSSGMAAAGQTMDAALGELGSTGQSTLPANTSGEAVALINERQDDVHYPIVASIIQSRTASCLTYIDAAVDVYHKTPRSLTVTMIDGSRSELLTMQESFDDGIGYKNTAKGKYSVETSTNQGYNTEQEQSRKEIIEQLQYVAQGTPEYALLVNAMVQTGTGEATELSRKLARINDIKAALMNGIEVEPKTEEEAQLIQQIMMQMQNQQPQPDPALEMAKAEQMNAQAKAEKNQLDAIIEAEKLDIERAKLQIKAQEVGANINLKNAQTVSTQLDSLIKQVKPI